jgi:hypothetical protein
LQDSNPLELIRKNSEISAQKEMANLLELTEYLYGDSPDVRLHGIKEIASLIIQERELSLDFDFESIIRILLRLAAEETDILSDESAIVLGLINFLTLEKPDFGIVEAVAGIVLGNLERLLIVEGRSAVGDGCSEYVHQGVLFLSSKSRSTWDPHSQTFLRAMRAVASLLTWSSDCSTVIICLKFVRNLSVLADAHATMTELELPMIVQGCLRRGSAEVKQASLEALYNMSFNEKFLQEVALSDFFELVYESPLAVRILVNAYRIVPRMAGLLMQAECVSQVLWAMQKGRNSREFLVLLHHTVEGGYFFSDSLKDLLLSVLKKGVQLRDISLLRAALLFRRFNVPDDVSEDLVESAVSPASESDEVYTSTVFLVVAHLRSELSGSLFSAEVEKIVRNRLDDRFIKVENVEKIIPALRIAQLLDLSPDFNLAIKLQLQALLPRLIDPHSRSCMEHCMRNL